MKKRISILLLFIAQILVSQSFLPNGEGLPDIYSLQEMNVKGNVSQIIDSYYEIANDGKKGDKIIQTLTYDFNKNNKVFKVKRVNAQIQIESLYYYDSNGYLIKWDVDGKNISVEEYVYKNLENTVVRYEVENVGKKYYDEYKYDNSDLVEWNVYRGRDEPYKYYKYTFNKKKQISISENFFTKIVYTYDSQGNVVKEVHTKIENGEYYKTKENSYEYDKNKNWISMSQTLDMNYSKPVLLFYVERKYIYNNK